MRIRQLDYPGRWMSSDALLCTKENLIHKEQWKLADFGVAVVAHGGGVVGRAGAAPCMSLEAHAFEAYGPATRQAPHFLKLPKRLRGFLSQFFVLQRQRPTADHMLARPAGCFRWLTGAQIDRI